MFSGRGAGSTSPVQRSAQGPAQSGLRKVPGDSDSDEGTAETQDSQLEV